MLTGGIIGFGVAGQELTHYLNKGNNPRARIVAACDRSQPRLDLAAAEFGLRVTRDVQELCGWGLDFVMVTSSNSAHREHVLAAAARGLPIFCEKPVAVLLPDALAMVEAVEKAGVVNTVNYSLRYTTQADQIQSLLQRGAFGEILSISYERCRPNGLHASGARHWATERPEESGGWIVHHCCHQLDFLYFLFGPFREVYCTTRTTVPGGNTEELVFATGRLRSGAMFHVGDSLARLPYEHLVITGSRGSFASQLAHPYHFDRFREEHVAQDEVMSFECGWMRMRDRPMRSVEHFFDCLEGRATPVATLRSSIESLRVAHAMLASAASGTVVTLDE